MKKLFKGITISVIAIFLIINTSTAKASDDEEPKSLNGTDIPMSVELLMH